MVARPNTACPPHRPPPAARAQDDEPRNIGTAEEEQQRLAEADPAAVVDGFGEFLAELGR